jgi:Na+/proline symporter
VWKGRKQKELASYLLADRKLKAPTIALSIMATQASAITFLSTPGQAYVDGVRFVQFYLGLPIAMVILAVTAVPIYHRLKVYTAYEYLETRFGVGTRTLTAILFLIQRGLSTGITIYAPALIVSVILGWNIHLTNVLIGVLVIIYTTSGGTKAVSWTHVHQLLIALGGMAIALIIAVKGLPGDMTLVEATKVAGRMGRMNAIDFTFDLTTPYNFWSGLFGGLMVALSYFGTDQSQVQRYLTGSSVAESRLGLLINGMVKVPMQFFILFVGAMVFVFYQFIAPPLFFNSVVRAGVEATPEYRRLDTQHHQNFTRKRDEVQRLVGAMRAKDEAAIESATTNIRQMQAAENETRKAAVKLVRQKTPGADASDANYVFLTFVITFLPAGLVGLLLAAIFCAAMSSTASGLNSLASTTVVDIVRRLAWRDATDHQYVRVGKVMTVFWGVFSIAVAEFASRLGSLIEAVNKLGSLFYGTMLAIFLLAFYTKRVNGTAVVTGAIIGEAAVIWAAASTNLAWLWWNVIGCVVGVVAALLISFVRPSPIAASAH